ncbi:MAG: permease [Deltaproteobacteria bacterium]|nr:permease [Deltaproteobacteria bacterium]
MTNILKRYKIVISIVIIDFVLIMAAPDIGSKSIHISVDNLTEMLIFIPPIFVLLGLLDVWVERETMMRLMGDLSGFLGVTIAFILGSFAAGPLYAAFPVAGAMLKKGSKFSNVLIFIGAWSTTKIPMLMFEASSMGWQFTATRFVVDIPGIALIAYAIEKMTTYQEKELIYEKALSL